MNSIRSFSVGIVALLALATVARAQDLVSFPAGNASWTVDITSSSSKPPPASAPKFAQVTHVEVTQLNNAKRARLTWSDGKVTEKWNIPGLKVTFNEDPRTGVVRPRQNGSDMEAATNANLTYDSFAFTWLSPQCLKEKDPVSYQGKDCYHYVGAIPSPFAGASAPTLKREAWIEAKTLLPVALITQNSTSTFTFADKPPTGVLTPPPAFAREISYYKGVMGGK